MTLDLKTILARVEAATSGPWYSVPTEEVAQYKRWMLMNVEGPTKIVGEACMEADGAFIAAARTDVPALVARIQQLEEERETLINAMRTATPVPSVTKSVVSTAGSAWDIVCKDRDEWKRRALKAEAEFDKVSRKGVRAPGPDAPWLTCDVRGCDYDVVSVCVCTRCAREDERAERFVVCDDHINVVEGNHRSIRGRPAQWKGIMTWLSDDTVKRVRA